ncbi:hypothetical protein BGZ92_009007, partial [Podila epicladia]
MPSRISIELSPGSTTDSMTAVASTGSFAPVSGGTSPIALKKKEVQHIYSNGMDDATMSLPRASPVTTSSSASYSSSSRSSSRDSSPSSSVISLPTESKGKGKGKDHSASCATTGHSSDAVLPTTALHSQEPHLHPISSTTTNVDDDDVEATTYSQDMNTNGKGKGKGKGAISDNELEASQSVNSGHGRSVTDSVNIMAKSSTSGSPVSNSPTRSDLYTSTYSRSSNSSSSTSLSSVEEDDESLDEFKAKPSAGSASRGTTTRPHGPSVSSGRPRIGTSTSQYLYPGSSSVSGSGSGSGSSSGVKPGLQRASTTPASMFPSSTSISPVPVPIVESSKPLTDQDLSLYSYDAIPDGFDFGDLPFYDTDPRTGTIYGDPHAITRPYLVPEVYFDLYRL